MDKRFSKDGFFYSRYEFPASGSELSGKNEYQSVYYHKLGDTVKLNHLFRFTTTTYPYFNHNYAAGTINKFLNGKKTASGDSLMFVQGMAGTNVKIEFPNLKKLFKKSFLS